jgi:hypothetical protein
MRLKTVPARQGLRWVRAGFAVFFRQPVAFSALFALAAFAALMLLWLPYVGPVLALSLMPTATVGFMRATQAVLGGRIPMPDLLLTALRDRRSRAPLLQLGATYAAAAIVVALLADLADGGRLNALIEAMAAGNVTPEMLHDPQFGIGLVVRFALMSLLSLVFWHAPALVHWGGMTVGKAVFASSLACWRSLGAFTLYGLGWFVTLSGVLLALQLLFGALGQAQIAAIAALPAGMLFSAVFYASLHFSFVDSFEFDPPPESSSPPSSAPGA